MPLQVCALLVKSALHYNFEVYVTVVSTHKVYCTVKVVYTYGRLICRYRSVR